MRITYLRFGMPTFQHLKISRDRVAVSGGITLLFRLRMELAFLREIHHFIEHPVFGMQPVFAHCVLNMRG
jgi:hypothetical protein